MREGIPEVTREAACLVKKEWTDDKISTKTGVIGDIIWDIWCEFVEIC